MQLMTRLGENYQASQDYRIMHRRHRPPFHRWWVDQMLASPKIQQGLKVIKGPLVTKGKYEVTTENTEVKEMVSKLVDRFMLLAAENALEAVEWGYSTNELIYDYDPGTKDLNLYDVQRYKPTETTLLVGKNKNVAGFRVNPKKIEILRPKSFHFVHNKQHNRFFGLSALYGAFMPWLEEWAIGGLQDIKKLWFAKNCYTSGVLYFPPGKTVREGVEIPNHALAQEIANKMATGHIITIQLDSGSATAMGETPKASWYFEPSNVNNVPGGLLEAIETSKRDQLEGMGILTEVVGGEGGGFGSSTGRSIPVDMFHTTLQNILNQLIWEVNRQYIIPLLQINLKKTIDKIPPYDLKAYPIDKDFIVNDEGQLIDSSNPIQMQAEMDASEAAREIQEDENVEESREKGQRRNPGNRGQFNVLPGINAPKPS